MENEKLTVYKQIARDALMTWNGYSKEESTRIVTESSNEELEGQVYAEGSIDAAIKGLQEYSQEYLKKQEGNEEPISDNDAELLKEVIMTGNYRNGSAEDLFEIVRKKLGLLRDDFNDEQMGKDITDMVISVLSTIHNQWVKDNQKKFFSRDKKYQHMPIELIGWKEAKSDLLFLKPILEAMDLSDWISEESLEEAYNRRVQNFLEEKGITNLDELITQISRGSEFYPALEGQVDITEALKDRDFVEGNISGEVIKRANPEITQQLFRGKDNSDKELEELRREKAKLLEEAEKIGEEEQIPENAGSNLEQ